MQVTAPVSGFTGEVAGVHFVDGVGNTDNSRALAYFARHGYAVSKSVTGKAVEAPIAATPAEDESPSEDAESLDDSTSPAPARRSRRRS